MNFTTGQYKNQSRHGGFGGRDWSALEKRLNETREMLKEILANLQVVLQNLRAVNRLGKDQAHGAPGFGAKPAFAHAAGAAGADRSDRSDRLGRPAGAEAFARAKRDFGHGPFAQTGQSNKFKTTATGFARAASFSASEPGAFDSEAKNAKNPYGRAETAGAKPGARKTESPFQERARQRAKETFSAGAQANAGGKADSSSGAKTGGASGGASGGTTGGTTGRQQKTQAGSSRREFRRPFRPRGEMTLERARAILCLTSPRDEGTIKSAYRKKARQYHPDLGGDEEMMKDLNLAYDLLLQYYFSHQAPTERNQ